MMRGRSPGGALCAAVCGQDGCAASAGAALDSVVARGRAWQWLRAYGDVPRWRSRLARGLCSCLLVPALLQVAGSAATG